jgi:hypothetical protein
MGARIYWPLQYIHRAMDKIRLVIEFNYSNGQILVMFVSSSN